MLGVRLDETVLAKLLMGEFQVGDRVQVKFGSNVFGYRDGATGRIVLMNQNHPRRICAVSFDEPQSDTSALTFSHKHFENCIWCPEHLLTYYWESDDTTF